jgi:hypothetical protein
MKEDLEQLMNIIDPQKKFITWVLLIFLHFIVVKKDWKPFLGQLEMTR